MQTNILDAIAARDEAIEMVGAGADVRFMALAHEAVKTTAQLLECFTTDDVVAHCSASAAEPRAWGAVMAQAARDGLCEATDRTRRSHSRTCHARPKRVWKSLIFGACQ